MEVQLTPDRQALVRDAIASGRLHRPVEILASVELSKASLARGEGRMVTTREESDRLLSDITGEAWRGSPPNNNHADELPSFLPSGSPTDDIWLYIARESRR